MPQQRTHPAVRVLIALLVVLAVALVAFLVGYLIGMRLAVTGLPFSLGIL